MLPLASTRSYWEAQTAALARRINFAAWLAQAAPAVFFVATGFAVAVVTLRRQGLALDGAWWVLAAALGVTALVCRRRARAEFFGSAEARVWLETRLRLDARLTAAAAGLVPWPPEPPARPTVVRWRLRGPAAWLCGGLALVVAALEVPVPVDAARTAAGGPPPALRQTQDLLVALQETRAADPQAVQQLEDRAASLARRPADEQYSHAVLEAADALHGEVLAATAALARGLEAAAEALRETEDGPGLAEPAGSLAAALSGLRDGALPANRELLANLPAGGGALKNLTSAQREQLARQLALSAQGLRGIAGAAGAGVRVAQAGAEGVGLAAGGEGGDGESAPLMLTEAASNVGPGTAEGLPTADLQRLALGDKLGTQSGAPGVDPAKAVAVGAAGAVAAPAAGGEAVWVNRLTPTERAAVKRFFK